MRDPVDTCRGGPTPAAPGDAAAQAQPLCAAAALVERGQAFVFDVLLWRQPARAFALRFDGVVVAYVNRCAHVPVEMDWQPGQFLDADKRWIVCSIHGATYDPADGRCVAGPCERGRLMRIATAEEGGHVVWYPSRDIRPILADASGAADAGLADSGTRLRPAGI